MMVRLLRSGGDRIVARTAGGEHGGRIIVTAVVMLLLLRLRMTRSVSSIEIIVDKGRGRADPEALLLLLVRNVRGRVLLVCQINKIIVEKPFRLVENETRSGGGHHQRGTRELKRDGEGCAEAALVFGEVCQLGEEPAAVGGRRDRQQAKKDLI